MVTGNAVGDEIVNVSADVILELGKWGKWLQAIGIIVILWIGFQVVNLWLNRAKWKKLEGIEKKIDQKVDRIERKVDKILRERK